MGRAISASVIATAILSALIYANAQTGFLPEFDLVREIRAFNERLGLPATTHAAWITHALVGVILYGVFYAFIEPILPGGAAGQGLAFGLVLFLIMMVAVMPLAGRTLFAQDMGAVFIGAMAGMNLLYGLVIGVAFDALTQTDD